MKIKPPHRLTHCADRDTQETSNREFKPGRAFRAPKQNFDSATSGGTGIRPCGNGLVHVCDRNVTAIATSGTERQTLVSTHQRRKLRCSHTTRVAMMTGSVRRWASDRQETCIHVRLCGDRWRLGRLCAGSTLERRPCGKRGAARGRPGRQQRADPLPSRSGLDGQGQGLELGLRDRTANRPERSARLPAARQGVGRVKLDQRDGLYPGPGRRLRRLGCRRQSGLGLRRCAAVFQALGAQHPRPGRLARQRRPAASAGPAASQPLLVTVHSGGATSRPRLEPRLQWCQPGGGRTVPGDPSPWRALQRGQGLSDAGTEPAEPAGDHRRTGHANPVRRQARDWGRIPAARHETSGAGTR